MEYILYSLMVIGLSALLIHLLSSVIKGCVTTAVILLFIVFVVIMYKSTKEPVLILNKFEVINFGIHRTEDL